MGTWGKAVLEKPISKTKAEVYLPYCFLFGFCACKISCVPMRTSLITILLYGQNSILNSFSDILSPPI